MLPSPYAWPRVSLGVVLVPPAGVCGGSAPGGGYERPGVGRGGGRRGQPGVDLGADVRAAEGQHGGPEDHRGRDHGDAGLRPLRHVRDVRDVRWPVTGVAGGRLAAALLPLGGRASWAAVSTGVRRRGGGRGGVFAGRVGTAARQHGGLRAALVLGDQRHGRARQVVVRVGRVGGGLHERAEPVEQGGGSRPVPRAALQAGHDQAGQLGGQGGQVGLLGGQFDQHVHNRVALVGPVPSRGEQQGGAERVDVTGRRGVLGVAGLLGGHVGGCADGAAGGGQLHALGGAGHPEVDDPRAIRRHQHIGWLEVAVYQAGQVNGLQRLRAAGREPEHARHRQRAAHPDQLCSASGRARRPSPARASRPRGRPRPQPR